MNNAQQITERMTGLQRFLEQYVWPQSSTKWTLTRFDRPMNQFPPPDCLFSWQKSRLSATILIPFLPQSFRILLSPLLMSDSCLHLFLQSTLSVAKMEACAAGKTNYSVAQAVQSCGLRRFHSEEALHKDPSLSCDSDSDRYCIVTPGVFRRNKRSAVSQESEHISASRLVSSCFRRDPEPQIRQMSINKTESTPSFALLAASPGGLLSCSSGSTWNIAFILRHRPFVVFLYHTWLPLVIMLRNNLFCSHPDFSVCYVQSEL